MAIDRPDIFKEVVSYRIQNVNSSEDYTLTNWRYVKVVVTGTGNSTIYDSNGTFFTISKSDIIEMYAPSGTYADMIRFEAGATSKLIVQYLEGTIALT